MEVAGLKGDTGERGGRLAVGPLRERSRGVNLATRYFQPAVGTADAVSPRLAPASRADSARLKTLRGVGVQGSTTQSRPRCPFNQAPCSETLVLPLLPLFADALRRLTLSPPPPSHHAVSRSHLHRPIAVARSHLLAQEYDWSVSQWLVARTS